MVDIDSFDSVMRLSHYENLVFGNIYVHKSSLVLLYLGARGDKYYFFKLGYCVVQKDRRPKVYKILDGNVRFNKDSIEDYITYVYVNGIESSFIGTLGKESLNFLGRMGNLRKNCLAGNIVDRVVEDYIQGKRDGHRRSSCFNSSVFLVKGCEYTHKKTNDKIIYLGLQCCSAIGSSNLTDRHLFVINNSTSKNNTASKALESALKVGVDGFMFDVDMSDLEHTFRYYKGLNVNNYNPLEINGY